MDTTGGELERGRDGPVEILTLNRPEQRNALSPALLEQLSAALADIMREAGVRAVVLTAAGNRAFCAGMDLKAFAAGGVLRDMAATAELRPGDDVCRGRAGRGYCPRGPLIRGCRPNRCMKTSAVLACCS